MPTQAHGEVAKTPDDEGAGLPPLGGDDSDGVTDVPVGDDVAFDDHADDESQLDDTTAERDPIRDDELEVEIADDDAERWTDGSDEATQVPLSDGEADADEYGWTTDSDEPAVEGAEELLGDLGEESGASLLDDEHDEGPDEQGDRELGDLPAMDRDAEADAEADDLELGGEDRVASELSFEQEVRMAGASLPGPAAPGTVSIEWLGPVEESLVAVATGVGATWVLGERLWLLEGPRLQPVVVTGMDGVGPTSLAVDPADGSRLVVGTALAGAFRSVDGGSTWATANGWRRDDEGTLSLEVLVEPHAPGGARLWGRTRTGSLFASPDFGLTWKGPAQIPPVAAITADEAGGIVAVCTPTRGAASIVRSEDGGSTFETRELGGPPRPPSDGLAAAASGDTIVLGIEGDPRGVWVSRDGGGSFDALAVAPSPSAVLFASGRLWVATFLLSIDRGVLVGDALGRASLVLDVAAERAARRIEATGESDGENRIAALAKRGGVVWAATAAGLFRVTQQEA